MVIIKFNHKEKSSEILFNGDLANSISKFNKITEKFENDRIFMVNEINIGEKNGVTLVREFANLNGHLFDLIICGGTAQKIKNH